MKYFFNEGSLSVPDYLEDRTVNVLAPRLGSGGMTMAITRDPLQSDESLSQFLDRQLADLARQVAKYQKGPQEVVHLGGGHSRIEGLKFPVSYKQQGKVVHHVQAAFVLPSDGRVLSVTFSSPVAFTAEQQQTVNAVLSSFDRHIA